MTAVEEGQIAQELEHASGVGSLSDHRPLSVTIAGPTAE